MEKFTFTKLGQISLDTAMLEHYEMDFKNTVWSPRSYEEVFKVKYKPEGITRIVRRILRSNLDMKKFLENVSKIETDHPNSTRVYEWFTDKYHLYITTELTSTDNIVERFAKMKTRSDENVAYIVRQILSWLNYYQKKFGHSVNVVPNKIYFQDSIDDMNIKIDNPNLENAILNSLTIPQSDLENDEGVNYKAPEALSGKPDPLSGVWSTGVIVYQLISGQLPFQDPNVLSLKNKIKSIDIHYLSSAWKGRTHCKELVKKMIAPLASRISIEDVMKDEWILKTRELSVKETEEMADAITKDLKEFGRAEKIKHSLLSYIAIQVSEKELTFVKKAFTTLDKNGDGRLSKEELAEGLKSIIGEASAEKLMKSMDEDKSGFVDYNEFMAPILGSRVASNKARLMRVFGDIDKNADGFIPEADLKTVLSPYLGESDGKEWLELFKKIDKNKDGKISVKEFMDHLTDQH